MDTQKTIWGISFNKYPCMSGIPLTIEHAKNLEGFFCPVVFIDPSKEA